MIIVKDGKCKIEGDNKSLLVELAAIFKGLEMMDRDILWTYAPIKSNTIGVNNDTYNISD